MYRVRINTKVTPLQNLQFFCKVYKATVSTSVDDMNSNNNHNISR